MYGSYILRDYAGQGYSCYASQQECKATVMHITGALHAGASEQELLETAFTIMPVAGMPTFAVFQGAWRQA